MLEPHIKYTIGELKPQSLNNCVAYALSHIIEKLVSIKFDIDYKIDDERMSGYLRRGTGYLDYNKGINLRKALFYLRGFGWEDYRIRFSPFTPTPETIHTKLKLSPVLLVIGMRVGTGRHAVVVWEWNGENFIILDPVCKKLIPYSPSDLMRLVKTAYKLSVVIKD